MFEIAYDDRILVLLGESIFLFLLLGVVALFSLHNIHKGTLYDLNDRFVDLQGFLELYLDRFVVVPVNKLVERLQLLGVPVPQPLFYFGELSPNRPLLVPIQLLHLNVALIPQVLHNFIHSLVVDCLDHAPVGLG